MILTRGQSVRKLIDLLSDAHARLENTRADLRAAVERSEKAESLVEDFRAERRAEIIADENEGMKDQEA